MSDLSYILDVQNLKTEFVSNNKVIPAVDGVDIQVKPGETVGVVGESGSGKTVTSLSVMRLLPKKNARVARGKIFFKERNLLELSDDEMRRVRGKDIAMIFQEPMTSLNPVHTISQQLVEMIRLHRENSYNEAREHALTMLKKVNIPRPEKSWTISPSTFRGMRQRVMIAMAMSCNPSLLIADEPTTALDVTIQAQILDLMRELRSTQQMSILLITHDLGSSPKCVTGFM